MTAETIYRCNLCGEPAGYGVLLTAGPKIRLGAESLTSVHICVGCLAGLADELRQINRAHGIEYGDTDQPAVTLDGR